MKTQHTPGPWKHANRGDYDTSGIGIFANNNAGMPYYVAMASYMGTADRSYAEANARLIASAPELLSALEFLLADYIAIDGEELTGSAIPVEKARAALRKAKGEI